MLLARQYAFVSAQFLCKKDDECEANITFERHIKYNHFMVENTYRFKGGTIAGCIVDDPSAGTLTAKVDGTIDGM